MTMGSKSLVAATLIAACSLVNAHDSGKAKERDVQGFEFSGTVLQSLPMAPQGSKVTGTFSFDMSVGRGVVGERDGRGYGYASYQYPMEFTLKVNGHSIASERTFVDVTNDFGGNVEDAISITGGYPVVIDGTTFPEGVIALSLASGPGRKQVLKSTDLPNKLHLNQFNAAAYGLVLQSGGPNDGLLYFSIDSIEPVRPR
jgi:hypothetical protein